MAYENIEITQDYWYTEDGANVLHRVRACNRDTVDHRVQIRDYPYDADRQKIGARQIKELTIPAGECRSWTFSINTLERGAEVPAQNYLDVYWWSEETDSWNVGDFHGQLFEPVYIPPYPSDPAVASASPMRLMVATAYPHRLETIGTPLSMYVRRIRGLPEGWRVRSYPELQQRFLASPADKEIPVVADVVATGSVAEGTLILVEVDVGIDGFPADWIHSMRHLVPLVRDTLPPVLGKLKGHAVGDRPALRFQLAAADPVGGLAAPSLRWSPDAGRSWRHTPMRVREVMATGALGITEATFEATVTVQGWGTSVLAGAEVADRLGNVATTPMGTYGAAPHPAAC